MFDTNKLPYIYQAVTWIQPSYTGKPYFSLPVPTNTLTSTLEFIFKDPQSAFGSEGPIIDSCFMIKQGVPYEHTCHVKINNVTIGSFTIEGGWNSGEGKYSHLLVGGGNVYVNGELLGTYTTGATAETVDFYGMRYFKYLKVVNGNNVACECIPCYRKADNVPGVFEVVSGVFYPITGAGFGGISYGY